MSEPRSAARNPLAEVFFWASRAMSNDYRILVATDLGTGTDRLLAEVQRYGQALNAIIDIIHAAPPDPDFVGYIKNHDKESQNDQIRESKAKALRAEHRQAQDFEATLRANGVRVDRTLMVQGPILETILEHVRKFNSDLLILGSHRHSALHRFWYGDTATDAVKQAPCALLLVPITYCSSEPPQLQGLAHKRLQGQRRESEMLHPG